VRNAWHDLWGSARGPVIRLAPQTRIVCGACVFATCMVAPVATWPGIAAVTSAVVLWEVLVRPPARVVRSTLLFGLALFLPYFLLAPLIRSEASADDWTRALLVPWVVFFRGMTAMQASVSTTTTLSASELRQGLSRLPVPGAVSAVLIQIVHQTACLLYETRRIAAAVAVRGGTAGHRTAIAVLASLPRVWLPRVIDRAERVGLAMELRGYCRREPAATGSVPAAAGDGLATGGALLVLAGAVALRLWGTP